MYDYSQVPRTGYTRSGKSLKAVRRYYALKDAEKQRRSPEARNDSERKSPNSLSVQKRKKTPDDNLSKRIAAELKVQQEAIEKRSRRFPGVTESPTDRPSLPIIVQPKETGPFFTTEAQAPTKSAKSFKSTKSLGTTAPLTVFEDFAQSGLSVASLGYVFTCLMIGTVYIVHWAFVSTIHSVYYNEQNIKGRPESMYRYQPTYGWLGISSIFVVVTVLYWFLERAQFKHCIVCLILMISCTISIFANIIYTLIMNSGNLGRTEPATESHVGRDESLNFWLPIVFLVIHFITTGLMIKNLINLLSNKIIDKSLTKLNQNNVPPTQMSMYLAPV